MKQRIRFFCLSLLVMVAGMAHAQNVAKVGTTEYATIDEAVAAWGPGKTLTLLDNVTTTSTVEVEINATKSTQGWTLNLGDYTWTANGCNAIHLFAAGGTPIHQNYGLKIYANQSGGITASGKYTVYYTNQGTCSDSRGYRPRLEINGGTYNASSVVYYGTYAFSSTANGASVFLNKSADGTEPVFNGNFGLSKCPVTVNAGYFNGTQFTVYRVSSTVEPNIFGGHFKTYSAFPVPGNDKGILFGNYKVFVKADASIDMTNGAPAIYEAKATKTLLLSTYQGKQYNDYIYYEKANDAIKKYSSGTIEIVLAQGVTATESKSFSSGTLTIDASAEGASYTGNITLTGNNAKFIVKFPEGSGHYGVSVSSGGTLHVEESVADGIVTRTYSRIGTVSDPEAKVGDNGYSTVYDAFYAIDGTTDNKTIVLQKDVTNAGIVTNGTATGGDGKTVATFDLNGKSIGIGSVAAGNNADYTLTIIDSSQDKTGTVTNSDASLFILALTGINDYSGSYTLKIQAGTWQFDPSNVVINGETHNLVDEGYAAKDNGDGTWTVGEVEYVAKIGNKKYTTLQGAFNAANDGDVVELLKDYDAAGEAMAGGSRQFVINKSIIFDGGGYTLTTKQRGIGVGNVNGDVAANIDVTIKNVTVLNTSDGARCIDTRGMIGSLTLEGVTLSTDGAPSGYTQPLTIGGSQTDAATVTITNSTIQTNDDATAYYAIITFNPVNMNITNSTIKGWANIFAKGKDGSAGSASSVFNIDQCTLVSTNEYSGESNAFGAFVIGDNNVTINVTNSDIQINNTGDQWQTIVSDQGNTYTEGGVNLGEGNTITLSGQSAFAYAGNNLAVSGGVSNVPVPEEFCAEGMIPTANTDSETMEAYPYTVKVGQFVAQIEGGAKYETLQAAVDAAEEGATIDILKDFTLTTVTTSPSEKYNVNIDKSVTINGNSHVITGSEGKRSIILMGEGKNITLKDLTLKNNKSEACLWIGDAVNATLDNVTLDGTNGIAYNQPLTIGQFESENRVTLNITNGSVIKTNDAGTAHYSIIAWHPADITVTGSKLIGWANVYLKPDAAGSTVKIEGSEMKSQGLSGSSNNFAIIVTEGNGNTIEVKDTKIESAAVEGTYQSLFRLGGQDNVLKFLGSTTYETNDMTWGCATYDPGSVFNNKVYFDDATKAAFADYFAAEDGPTISGEKESPINLYPLVYSPEVFYYWEDGQGGYEGVYTDFANPFEKTEEFILGDGEYIKLMKDITLDHNIVNPLAEGTINLLLGNYTITKGDYSLKLKEGQSFNTDKQTDIFTAVDADYKVVETAVEGRYTYTVVAKEYVAQIGDVKYETLAEAVAAVPADGTETTITMIANHTIDIVGSAVTIPAGKKVVLDLNGYQVVGTAATATSSALITNRGNLTIKDSSDANADGNGNGKLISGATTTWIYDGSGDYSGSYASNTITNGGTLTIESGYIENISTGSAVYAVDNNSSGGNAILNMNGGLLKAHSVAVRQFANSTTLKNEVNIAGGTVTAGYSGIWIQLPGSDATKAVKATLNVTGGTLNGGSYAFYDYSYGNLYDATQYNLSGGTFNGDIFSYGANINITDGTYNGEVAIKQAKPSIIAVSGGKFAGDVYTYGDNASEGFITGGVYAINTYEYQGETYDCDWLYLLAEGYVAVDNTDEATMAQYPYTVKSKEEAGLFDLIDGEPYERTADVQAKKVTYTRTFPYQVSGSLQCWVVPFDYTITEEDLQNLSFYKTHLISAVESATGGMVEDDNKIYLYYQPVEAGTVLKANKPYFVKVNEKTTENKTFTFAAENVKLKAKNDDRLLNVSTSRFNFDFYAAYVSGFKPEAEHWLGVNQYGSLFWNKPTSKLASSYRWYIEVTDNEDDYAKITFELIEEGDATTTIENGSVDSNADIEGFYTVGGVKLNTPAKGLNIVKYTDGTTMKVYIKK